MHICPWCEGKAKAIGHRGEQFKLTCSNSYGCPGTKGWLSPVGEPMGQLSEARPLCKDQDGLYGCTKPKLHYGDHMEGDPKTGRILHRWARRYDHPVRPTPSVEPYDDLDLLTCTGAQLDKLAEMYGVRRRAPAEPDASLRNAVLYEHDRINDQLINRNIIVKALVRHAGFSHEGAMGAMERFGAPRLKLGHRAILSIRGGFRDVAGCTSVLVQIYMSHSGRVEVEGVGPGFSPTAAIRTAQ